MPFLRLTLDRSPTTETQRRLAEAITELTAAVLGKNYSLTSLAIDVIAPGAWTIGAETMAERGQATAYLDVKVTAGTNTAEEKEAFIERAFHALQDILGPLAPATYIVIDEIPAESWGYQGRTAARRLVTATT
jgi:4-oxalocrotonate tautomerase